MREEIIFFSHPNVRRFSCLDDNPGGVIFKKRRKIKKVVLVVVLTKFLELNGLDSSLYDSLKFIHV